MELSPSSSWNRCITRLFGLGAFLIFVLSGSASEISPSLGTTFKIAGQTAAIARFDTLRFVQNGYTRRFKFDSADNPKLRELRDRYHLEEIVAPGKNEFERQVLLMDWVHHRFEKFGHPSTNANGALEILKGIERGNTFFCTQFAQLMVSTAASLGWIDRPLALRRHQGANARGGSTEHSTTEIWSNQHRKWVMLDPTSNMYLEKRGVPLNAFEIRQEWFYNDGRDLVFVLGKDHKRYSKSELPIFLRRFADFGDLSIDPDELDKYGFIGYIPNTDLMDSGFDYGRMFITKDQLCDGTPWHKRDLPAYPAVEPYFAVGGVDASLRVHDTLLLIDLKTFTPNLRTFQVKFDQATEWKDSPAEIQWKLHAGANRLQARTINAFGVGGPEGTVEIQLAPE